MNKDSEKGELRVARGILPRLSRWTPLRWLLLPLFSVLNPGDVTIRHHFTGSPFRLHAYRHKGYWFFGKSRESETMRFFEDFIRKGDTVLEIGGHIGYVSVYLADLVGPDGTLVVLEPGRNNLPYLKHNTSGYPNVSVIEEGAADIDGELTLYVENLTGQNDSFVRDYQVFRGNARNAGRKAAVAETRVPVVTVDRLVEERSLKPSLIKIDVEGFEEKVLRGMGATLAAVRPGLMVEVTQNPVGVLALLEEYNYLCYDRQRKLIRNPAEAHDNIFCLHPDVHKDRMGAFGLVS